MARHLLLAESCDTKLNLCFRGKCVLMCVKCTDEGYADGGTSGMKGFPVIAAFKLSKIDRPCLRAVEI